MGGLKSPRFGSLAGGWDPRGSSRGTPTLVD